MLCEHPRDRHHTALCCGHQHLGLKTIVLLSSGTPSQQALLGVGGKDNTEDSRPEELSMGFIPWLIGARACKSGRLAGPFPELCVCDFPMYTSSLQTETLYSTVNRGKSFRHQGKTLAAFQKVFLLLPKPSICHLFFFSFCLFSLKKKNIW